MKKLFGILFCIFVLCSVCNTCYAEEGNGKVKIYYNIQDDEDGIDEHLYAYLYKIDTSIEDVGAIGDDLVKDLLKEKQKFDADYISAFKDNNYITVEAKNGNYLLLLDTTNSEGSVYKYNYKLINVNDKDVEVQFSLVENKFRTMDKTLNDPVVMCWVIVGVIIFVALVAVLDLRGLI